MVAALAVSGATAGCTADEQPVRGDGRTRPTASPSADPPGAVPYDLATAPAAFTNRAVLTDCGAVLDIHTEWPSPPTPNQAADDVVRDCWRGAREDRRGAEARIVALSIDSGPVFVHLRTTDAGGIETWISSKDRLAGPDAPVVWRHQTCTSVHPRNLVPVDCTDL